MKEEEAFKVLKAVALPDRAKIVMMLEERELSFSDIKNNLGQNYNSGLLYYHLRELEKAKAIINKKKLDLSSKRPKTSFYRLSGIGKVIAEYLVQCLSKLKDVPC